MGDSPTLCEKLPWDSNFFGLSIARAIPAHLDASTRDEVFEWCRTRGVECLYFLTTPADATTITLLNDGGFQLVGVRATLARHAPAGKGELRGHVRPAVDDDIPAVREIALSAHRDTRFHADSRFDKARCDELYATWIENSIRGYADHVLIAERNNAPAGYLTLHVTRSDSTSAGARGSARIGLFAVHERHRNQSVGRDLLRRAAQMLAEQEVIDTSVVTSGRNLAALSLYKGEGFRTVDVALWYHRWFERRR